MLAKKSNTTGRGNKSKYSAEQKRQAEHIEKGYEKRGITKPEAERRAWATENKISGGGRKGGTGRPKSQEDHTPMKKGGVKGGAKGGAKGGKATAARPAAARSASAKKAAATRKANTGTTNQSTAAKATVSKTKTAATAKSKRTTTTAKAGKTTVGKLTSARKSPDRPRKTTSKI